jgi:flagellar motility protein MotE (MotC chaperone)
MGRLVKNMTIVAVFGSSLVLGMMPQLLSHAEAESENTAAKQSPEPGKETMSAGQQPPNASRAAREEKALQDARRLQLSEKEAALAAKEQELKKMSAKLDAQLKLLEERKKQLDDSLKQKKKTLDDKRKRMFALLKKMRPEQAGQYLSKMEEVAVISILNDLDNKMVLKLMPFLNQPMVLKWIKENLNNS